MELKHRAVVIALLVTSGASVPSKADTIDDYITAQMELLHIPGGSLAIVRDGRVSKAQGYGFANFELKAPARRPSATL
jgi:CubicO group peptidase (beta-lactamase class C family)